MSLKNIAWWRFRALEFAVALGVVAAGMFISENIQMHRRVATPASSWFVVNQIYVPEHVEGANPDMNYDRTIKEPFQGFWVVEVQRLDATGSFILECSGSGVNDYEVSDYIPENTVSWDWFIGEKCRDIPPGEYQLRASWKLKRSGWPEKEVVTYSNVFKVSPK